MRGIPQDRESMARAVFVGKIVILTLMTNLWVCILLLIGYAIAEGIQSGVYVALMSFGNILIPTWIAVLIYALTIYHRQHTRKTVEIIPQILTLTALYGVAMITWVIVECVLFDGFTWDKTINILRMQYVGYFLILLSEAILIPIFGHYLTRANP